MTSSTLSRPHPMMASLKPDPEFYNLILERLNVQPERSIFVDDQDYCLDAARELGIVTVKAVTPEQHIAEVKSLLLQNCFVLNFAEGDGEARTHGSAH